MDFQEYLQAEVDAGKTEFRLVAIVRSDGASTFYIHPSGKDGKTVDYQVMGNKLTPINNALEVPVKPLAEDEK